MLTKISILILCITQICAYENGGTYEISNHTFSAKFELYGLDTINIYSTDSILTNCTVTISYIDGNYTSLSYDKIQLCIFDIYNEYITAKYTITVYSVNNAGNISIFYTKITYITAKYTVTVYSVNNVDNLSIKYDGSDKEYHSAYDTSYYMPLLNGSFGFIIIVIVIIAIAGAFLCGLYLIDNPTKVKNDDKVSPIEIEDKSSLIENYDDSLKYIN